LRCAAHCAHPLRQGRGAWGSAAPARPASVFAWLFVCLGEGFINLFAKGSRGGGAGATAAGSSSSSKPHTHARRPLRRQPFIKMVAVAPPSKARRAPAAASKRNRASYVKYTGPWWHSAGCYTPLLGAKNKTTALRKTRVPTLHTPTTTSPRCSQSFITFSSSPLNTVTLCVGTVS
jgi:hypothetical protein